MSQAVGVHESLEFLIAVSDFKRQPSAKAAQAIVEKFIAPSAVDDFGMPIDDETKMQINMADDEARKALIQSVKSLSLHAESGGDDKAMQLAGVFDPTERNMALFFDRAMNNQLTLLRQQKSLADSAPAFANHRPVSFA